MLKIIFLVVLKDINPEVNKLSSIKVEIDGQEIGIDLGLVVDLEEEYAVFRKQPSYFTH